MDYQQGGSSNSRQVVARNATQGAFAIGGGIAILVVGGIAAVPVIGQIVGAVIGAGLLIGGLGLRSKNKGKSGASPVILAALGGLTLASALSLPLLGGIAATVLTISGLGLLGFGAWKIWSFYKGYKERTR